MPQLQGPKNQRQQPPLQQIQTAAYQYQGLPYSLQANRYPNRQASQRRAPSPWTRQRNQRKRKKKGQRRRVVSPIRLTRLIIIRATPSRIIMARHNFNALSHPFTSFTSCTFTFTHSERVQGHSYLLPLVHSSLPTSRKKRCITPPFSPSPTSPT